MFKTLKFFVKCISGAAASLIGWNTKLSIGQTLFGVFLIGLFWLVAILSYYLSVKAGSTKLFAVWIMIRNLSLCMITVVLFTCLIDLIRFLLTQLK